jgi:hypothetical protein
MRTARQDEFKILYSERTVVSGVQAGAPVPVVESWQEIAAFGTR